MEIWIVYPEWEKHAPGFGHPEFACRSEQAANEYISKRMANDNIECYAIALPLNEP